MTEKKPDRRGETFVMGEGENPPETIDFKSFLLGLASTILIHLGEVPHPELGNVEKDVDLAKQSLDVLVLLRDKTRNNLTPEEDTFFQSLMSDLQIRFVQLTKKP